MMEHEYETKAWIDGNLVEVVATFETDFPDVLIYGIFDGETDVTEKIHPDEFDRIYREVLEKMVSDLYEAAEMACDMER